MKIETEEDQRISVKRNRALLALLPVALVGTLLASCSTDTENDGSDASNAASECIASGSVSESVNVSGDAGSALTLEASVPLEAPEVQRSVLIEGEGGAPSTGQGVVLTTTVFNGVTGEIFENLGGQGVLAGSPSGYPWVDEVVPCATSGQRTVLVGAAEDFGIDPTSLGLEAGSNLTFVTDVVAVLDLPSRAEGAEQTAPDGLPAVTLDADGAPTIEIAAGADAPEELQIATLIEGDGAVVEPGDIVFVNYRGVLWPSGEEFDSSWSRGAPIAFSTEGVITGFKAALEGQKVGSQIISVVPSADGYNDGETRVFVLDILGSVSLP